MRGIALSNFKLFEPFFWIYYIWYYFPVARTFFKSSTYNKLFFGIFVCGCVLCLLQMSSRSKQIVLRVTPLAPVLVYFLMFTVLTVFQVATAERHIRISFTFWATLVVFYLMKAYPAAQKRLGKLMFTMLLITAVTSIIGVFIDPRAARMLAFAENNIEEDLTVRMRNIGGIAFFQGLVICVPILVSFIKKYKYRVICSILLAVIFVGLMSASFTISVAMFFVALLLGWLANNASMKNVVIGVCLLVAILLVPWDDVFVSLSGVIGNESIKTRFLAVANSLSSGAAEGNLASRIDLYGASFQTFLNHSFGVGPHYTYINYRNGIGYHSQVLDDLARYGLFAVVFYVVFFVSYYRLLRQQWSKIDMQQVAWPIVVTYFSFLVLNPGFTSEHESVLLLFLIPVLPELFKKNDEVPQLSK